MKKITSIIFSVGLVVALNAQEVVSQTETTVQTTDQTTSLVSKKGIAILPQKGEYSLGINANPILNYLGGVMGGNGNAPSFNAPNEVYSFGISGKYMLSDKSALRVNLYTEMSDYKYFYSAPKSELTPDVLSPQYVEDVETNNYEDFNVSVGIEKRRGKSRVQGIYGIEGVLGLSSSQTFYTYGNDMTIDFNTPAINSNFDGYGSNGERVASASVNNSFLFGANGFVGVEFFFGPKLSLGGELGYSVRYRTSGNSETTYEYWSTSELKVVEYTTDADYKGSSSIGLFTQTSGSLKLNFYF